MDPTPKPETQNSKGKWYHQLWFVLVMLITIGPFAFPLLWKSSQLGVKTKCALTVIFTALTIFAVWGSVETVKFAIGHFQELQEALTS